MQLQPPVKWHSRWEKRLNFEIDASCSLHLFWLLPRLEGWNWILKLRWRILTHKEWFCCKRTSGGFQISGNGAKSRAFFQPASNLHQAILFQALGPVKVSTPQKRRKEKNMIFFSNQNAAYCSEDIGSFVSWDRKSQFQGGLRRRGEGAGYRKHLNLEWIRGGNLNRVACFKDSRKSNRFDFSNAGRIRKVGLNLWRRLPTGS